MSGPDPVLARLLGSLAGLWQTAILYPAAHPARVQAAERLGLALRDLLTGRRGLAMDLARGRLRVDDGGWTAFGEAHLGGLVAAARERGVPEFRVAGADGRDLLVEVVSALAGGGELPVLPAPAEESRPHPGEVRGRETSPAAGNPWEPLLHRLAGLWGEIASARRFPDEEADRLVRGIAGLPGDGVVEPVALARRPGVSSPVAHSLDVARLSYLAGRVLGLEPEPLRELTLAAALADIGMVHVPASLLEKQGTLSSSEFAIVRRHPVDGAEMLLATPGVPDLAGVIAWQHHRQRGGGGYPACAGQGRLHPATRLVQVADVYTALRSPRAFRPAIPENRARAILSRLGGSWLDEDAVTLVLERVAPLGLASFSRVPAPA